MGRHYDPNCKLCLEKYAPYRPHTFNEALARERLPVCNSCTQELIKQSKQVLAKIRSENESNLLRRLFCHIKKIMMPQGKG